MKLSKLYLTACITSLALESGQAAITYVDAEEGPSGNTVRTSDGDDSAWVGPWEKRVSGNIPANGNFGNNNTAFQALGGEPELTTTVSGLASDTYDVWVFFWDATNGNDQWTIDAGLTSGSLTSYTNDNPSPSYTSAFTVDAKTLTFSNSVLNDEGNRDLYGINLGQVTGTSIDVFIGTSATNSDSRTWYDGIGFEAVVVVPEPSSTALLGLGGLALMLRRKRG